MTSALPRVTSAPARDRLQAYLRANGVCFTLRHHPFAFTSHAVAASEHISDELLAKAVVVLADGVPLMVVMPAAYQVNLTKLCVALDAREVHLAREFELTRLFEDCDLGAIPPFGNLYDLEVFVDRTLADRQRIEFCAGTHTETIGVAYADYRRLVQPTVVDVGHFMQPRGRLA
jgi:Ala-tRNA(Pro) deacylase